MRNGEQWEMSMQRSRKSAYRLSIVAAMLGLSIHPTQAWADDRACNNEHDLRSCVTEHFEGADYSIKHNCQVHSEALPPTFPPYDARMAFKIFVNGGKDILEFAVPVGEERKGTAKKFKGHIRDAEVDRIVCCRDRGGWC